MAKKYSGDLRKVAKCTRIRFFFTDFSSLKQKLDTSSYLALCFYIHAVVCNSKLNKITVLMGKILIFPLLSWKLGEDQSSCPHTFRRPCYQSLSISTQSKSPWLLKQSTPPQSHLPTMAGTANFRPKINQWFTKM